MPSFTSGSEVLVTFFSTIMLFRPNLLFTATKLNSYAFQSFVVLVLAGTELMFFIVATMDHGFFDCAGNRGMFSSFAEQCLHRGLKLSITIFP